MSYFFKGLFAAPKQYPAFTGPHHYPSGMTQDRPSRLVGSRPRQTILPLKQSVICGKVPCIADAGLVMSRSFRVGWGPNWTLVHSGKAVGQRMSALGKHKFCCLLMLLCLVLYSRMFGCILLRNQCVVKRFSTSGLIPTRSGS